MKILQLNAWGGKLGANISKLIERENADVLCLQELVSVAGGNSFFFEDLETIQDCCGYEYAFESPSKSFNLMRREASWGDVIMSRRPFQKTKILTTYQEKIANFDFLEDKDYNAGRALQHVVVENDGVEVNILNHHGHHVPSHKNGDEETMKQCAQIADYIKSLSGPVVLCGDFNLIPESESLEQINKILVNHVKERGIISTRTPLTHKTEACDYIFTSSDIAVKNFQVLDDIVSDHKALTIEF